MKQIASVRGLFPLVLAYLSEGAAFRRPTLRAPAHERRMLRAPRAAEIERLLFIG
jgi:hypothetical protein